MKRLTTKEFIEKAYAIYGDLYDYSKVNYINSRTKVCIICKEHGEFFITPNNHLKGVGCPKCSRHVYDTESFIKAAIAVHGNKYLYTKTQFKNSRIKVIITCPIHGDFEQLPFNHINGEGCNKCKYLHLNDLSRSNTDEFIVKANKIHNNFYNYSKVNYVNNRTKIIITCPKHGDFLQKPHEHLSGYGCKKCLYKAQTRLYNRLLTIIPDLMYEVNKSTVPWIQNLRFDMYSPTYNIAIECDGSQHFIPVKIFGGQIAFEKTQERDKLKLILCDQNNCKLFRINSDYTEEMINDLENKLKKLIHL